MEIEVVTGTGHGKSDLGAFDAALKEAGIHNYNIVHLSSVIPTDAEVSVVGTHDQEWANGAKVATVITDNVRSETGLRMASGVGWAQTEDNDGGVFVERSAATADVCETELQNTLSDVMSNRPDWDWENEETEVVEAVVGDDHTATVAAAVYGPIQLRHNSPHDE